MLPSTPKHATLDEWIAREAIPFSLVLPESLNPAIDKMMVALGDSVELLGLGEAFHGGEEFLIIRNRLLQRLVELHGYSAIAIESSFPRAYVVNEYVAGRGGASYEEIQEAGFSHGFGKLAANRELIEWMRKYNADSRNKVKLQFYGFDSPTEMTATDSPRQLLYFALDYLGSIDSASANERRQRIDPLLGDDAAWENPAANFDSTKSIGSSPAATALRIETEDLITELQIRRPELIEKSDESRHAQAAHYASAARQLLTYHAAIARQSPKRLVECLGIRDLTMADNLAYMVACERGRGKVLAFAHNSHLKCGKAQWQLGPDLLIWWPAGAHLAQMFGPGYAVIGAALGTSSDNGIGQPEVGTLEARLTAAPGPARFVTARKGQGLPVSEIAALPTRSGSMKNMTYFPLTPESITEYDCLLAFDTARYNRGGPPLPDFSATQKQ